MTIRPMTAGDAPAVAGLSAQLGYPVSAETIAERFELISRSPGHRFFVAEASGEVAGWVHVYGVRLLESPRFFAEIGGLVVDAKARRRGIGRSLMVAAERWASDNGYAEVRLRSGLHRTDAHQFYQSLGYELTKTSYLFRKAPTADHAALWTELNSALMPDQLGNCRQREIIMTIDAAPRLTPEPLDNERLRRMIDDKISKDDAEHGAGHGLNLPVLEDLSFCIISDFDFSGLNLSGIHAQNTTFRRCRFVGTDLYGADLSRTIAPKADFQRAILAKAVFSESDLSNANFDDANLIQADFMDCDLRGATFRNADFSGGLVSDCNIEEAIFGPGYVQIT